MKLVAAIFALLSCAAVAQTYPTKPVRIIVTAPPGGSDDFMGRLLATRLSESTAKRFVVENRPGGGALLGRELVARSAPDGYTLLMAGSAMAAQPADGKRRPPPAKACRAVNLSSQPDPNRRPSLWRP